MVTFSQITVGQKFEVVGSGFAEGRTYQKTSPNAYKQVAPQDMFSGRAIKPRADIEVKTI